ncbi:hypothetical protein PTSG_08211 [Salpingoeca rosetta]|uniref:D-serine dehydratase n=1 Tax=Salpingoeca rosetta (strain ATCC 50818 / BSB-021) TaxID=946362 RepID=F2UIB4_SALR5|nr:uncharacterized protein PTSG_08211 [Salpingoeca rosetta]EGD76863.1 hypothetical protein PTSG_08211 [Salpingoeca rosetta]|eukprot:XP_004991235.1 hypothetical protein PTSG_08211 [Salpingoeca rosetta]
MLERAAALGVCVRPHVKTHKTIEGCTLLQTGGRRSRIVVSTLTELRYFLEHKFSDVLYAVPLGVDKIQPIVSLHLNESNDFQVLVDSPELLEKLHTALRTSESRCPLPVWIKIDCGYHRAGVQDPEDVLALAQSIKEPLTTLRGVYTHAGMSYGCRHPDQIQELAATERDAVVAAATLLRDNGIAVPDVGVGSTPTCSHPPTSGLEGVTEMHPGNYLFYDEMQAQISSCSREDIAAFVITRVIGVYPKRNQILIDAGWTATSSQGADDNFGGFIDHPNLKFVSMSQETSVLTSNDGSPLPFENLKLGTILRIRPYHACATCAMHTTLHIMEDGKITTVWKNECR